MAPEPPVELGDARRVLRRVDARGHGRAAVGAVEERHVIRMPAGHGYPKRLQQLGP